MERLIDGLKKSASRAGEFPKAEEKNKPQIFLDFIESIKIAAGSAHQLAHARENPKWLDMRDILENIITMGYTLPQRPDNEDQLWIKVQGFLTDIAEQARTLATMAAMHRNDVIANLDHRASVADKLN